MTETGTKVGIVGLGVLALVVAALYFVYVKGAGLFAPVTAAINKDDAISTNAARDPGDPAFVQTTGTDHTGITTLWTAPLNSTSVSLGGGAQLNNSLPSDTGSGSALSTTARGLEPAPAALTIQEQATLDYNNTILYNQTIAALQAKDAADAAAKAAADQAAFDLAHNVTAWDKLICSAEYKQAISGAPILAHTGGAPPGTYGNIPQFISDLYTWSSGVGYQRIGGT